VVSMLLGCSLAWGGLVWAPLKPLYDYGWFIGFGAAFLLYAALMRVDAPRQQ
jgi:cytosine/uracil/thiamine/allantoin permease